MSNKMQQSFRTGNVLIDGATLVFETTMQICIVPICWTLGLIFCLSHLISWVLNIHSSILSPAPEVANVTFFQIEFCIFLV